MNNIDKGNNLFKVKSIVLIFKSYNSRKVENEHDRSPLMLFFLVNFIYFFKKSPHYVLYKFLITSY